jgi:hypothetical protein
MSNYQSAMQRACFSAQLAPFAVHVVHGRRIVACLAASCLQLHLGSVRPRPFARIGRPHVRRPQYCKSQGKDLN